MTRTRCLSEAEQPVAPRSPQGPAPALESLLCANPSRRKVLKGSLGLSLLYAFGLSRPLEGCAQSAPEPEPPSPPVPFRYDVRFVPIARSWEDAVILPDGYAATVLFSAGDPVVRGSRGYDGSLPSAADAEGQAGGSHDGMHFFALPGVDPQRGGLLAVNHELPDYGILFANGKYDASAATDEQRRLALSAVGISVLEVELAGDRWRVKRDSPLNKRYTGNTSYRVSGPAAAAIGSTVVGTLNNCSSGATPWGTYLTCEETLENYLDPSRPALGYGWVVEIDPQGQLGPPTKRTALGRFDHENVAFLTDSGNRVAFYMGDDGTPGCIYKFVPSRPFSQEDRTANIDLLDQGTLYVARFNGDGTGRWIELTQGKNGLIVGASDPGNLTQGAMTPTPVDFASQADVLIKTKAAARVAGATLMDRPEWITVGPDRTFYCTLTNNAGRRLVDEANPRPDNRHGHIIRWQEAEDSPLAVSFTWSVFLLAGDPSLSSAGDNLIGDISGDTFSSPDGIRLDPQGRLWVETDMSLSALADPSGQSNEQVFGNNAMYCVDPKTRQSKRFLVGPRGCEITGIAYTPDLTTFFINIQHPTGAWPEPGRAPRSSTLAIRRVDGQPVGA